MSTSTALTPYALGPHTLTSKIVMSPMTRSRAINNVPNNLMADYYGQRASAGLIITEGVSPSPNGLGYARIPGIFSDEQRQAWKPVAEAVHKKGGKIFMQLMHSGRIGHPHNLPAAGKLIGPSAIAASGKMWTDKSGDMLEHPAPEAMSADLIASTKAEYVKAAQNAIAAGFDGVELHGANGYLLEQFLSPFANQRTDVYGGSIENRARFALEVAEAVSNAIGKDRTGIRLSPYGVFNDMPHYDEITATYHYLAEQLNTLGLLYIHLVDHSAGGAPEVPHAIKKGIRERFNNTLILSGGYTLARANEDLNAGHGDLVAFGKPFINNPDLVDRFRKNFPLNLLLDASTFYTPGAKGLIDYPVFADETVSA
ncbi:N-ethylmaleimide reductase [Chryseolinea serpens]|uniref:N-ethylmaleimide reductase n=1 Tax=Chryseolinea serpens TaxID=947013 RepID=A0A1M5R1F0_9BACT|nr:alkene reductase [Chryseolinea serpens]SHH19936.1 N-ethylmaleimide reductase [Chryseolinea serpens]